MNREDIIRMAREAGFSEAWLSAGENPPHFEAPADIVERFAALVADAEREACAKVCENIYTGDEGCGDWPTPEMCANAIRERSANAGARGQA